MKNVAELTDSWGAWVRIDVRPGTDNDDPQLIVVTITDETTAAVTLNYAQAVELAQALNEAVGGLY